MKKIIVLLLALLLMSCTTKLSEQKEIPYIHIQLIDNYDIIFERTGYIEVKREWYPTEYYKITEYTATGNYTIEIDKGDFATLIIEQIDKDKAQPAPGETE